MKVVEFCAPSQRVLGFGVFLALLATIVYFVFGTYTNYAFWIMTFAYAVTSLGAIDSIGMPD